MPSHETILRRRWLILGIVCMLNLCAGSIYAWSVLSAAMADHLTLITGNTVTPGDLIGAFSLANSISPIPMILGGFFNDRFGPRPVIMTGGLMIGAGLVAAGYATAPSDVILGYGIPFGLGLGLVYGAGISTVMKYFPDRRGFCGGLATAAYGMSSVIVPPVAQMLIASVGAAQTFVILGTVFTAVIFTGGLFCTRCPDGFSPDGKAAAVAAAGAPAGMTPRQMLASAAFWPMLALLMCGAVSGMMVLSQAATIAKSQVGLSSAAAATAVSTIALFNMAGRLVAGTLSDWFGRIAVLAGGLILSAAGLGTLTLATPEAPAFFYAGCSLIGISFGSFMSVFPGLTTDRFGAAHAGVNYGIMFSGFALAGLIGPAMMQQMRLAGFGYSACYGAAGAICALGLVLALVCARQNKRA